MQRNLQFVTDVEREKMSGSVALQAGARAVQCSAGGLAGLAGGDDVRIQYAGRDFAKAVGRGFRRSLRVVESPLLFTGNRRDGFRMCGSDARHVRNPGCCLCASGLRESITGVQSRFVHSDEADGGEAVVEGAEVMMGVTDRGVFPEGP